jgi:uncharacterized delta-60 repeat protein
MLRLGVTALGMLVTTLFALVPPVNAAPGDLDTTFSGDGLLTAFPGGYNWTVADVAVQSDGRIVTVGKSPGNYGSQIAGFTAAGDLDTGFSGNGYEVVTSSSTKFTRVAADNAGGWLVGHESTPSVYGTYMDLYRFTAAGNIDTSFGSSGHVSLGEGNIIKVVVDVAGRIVVVANYTDKDLVGSPRKHYSSVMVTRLLADGTADPSFNDGQPVELMRVPSVEYDVAHDAAVHPDGSVTIVVQSYAARDATTLVPINSSLFLTKVDADGGHNSSYGDLASPGWAALADLAPSRVAAQGSETILGVTLTNGSGDDDIVLRRYDDDGERDMSFGLPGWGEMTVAWGPSSIDQLQDLTVLPHGGVVAFARANPSGSYSSMAFSVHRPNGAFDTDFSGDGQAAYSFGAQTNAGPVALALSPSNKLVGAGHSSGQGHQNIRLMRLEGVQPWGDITPTYSPDRRISVRVGQSLADVLPAGGDAARPGETLEYSIDPALAPDLSFDEETGEITGTPDDETGDSGHPVWTNTHVHTVTVTSSYGRTAEATLKLTVQPEDVAQQFRPILRFDTGEPWRPLNVERFLEEDFADGQPGAHHEVCASVEQPTSCTSIDGSDALGAPEAWNTLWQYRGGVGAEKEDWPVIDVHGEGDDVDNFKSPRLAECPHDDLNDCDAGPNTSIYYRSSGPFLEANYRFLDYWVFYRYNKFDIGDHEADWEHITVARSATGDPATFDWVGMSAHNDTTFRYLRPILRCDDYLDVGTCGTEEEKLGTRPVVFVANGSHGNYPEPCSAPFGTATCDRSTSYGQIPGEKGYDGMRKWGADEDPAALIEWLEPSSWDSAPEPHWVNWPGRWGYMPDQENNGDRSHVESPGAPNRSIFYEPWDWECSERGSGDAADCNPVAGAFASSSGGESLAAPTDTASGCDAWAGPGVALSTCDPVKLRTSLRAGTLGKSFATPDASVGKHQLVVASSGGLTQVAGEALEPGDSLTLDSAVPAGAEVRVRVRTAGSRELVAEFAPRHRVRRGITLRFPRSARGRSIELRDGKDIDRPDVLAPASTP